MGIAELAPSAWELLELSALAVTPDDIDSAASPQVELGSYQVQIGTPATLLADFTIHG